MSAPMNPGEPLMHARRLLTAIVAVVLVMLGSGGPAHARPSGDGDRPAWTLITRTDTTKAGPARAAAPADDLKTECAKHSEAETDQGWPAGRYDQCFLKIKKAFILTDLETQQRLGEIDFSSSLLVHSYDNSRRVDYTFNFDEFSVDLRYGPEVYSDTTLTVAFGGCGALVTCSPALPQITNTAAGWALAPSRNYDLTVTSNDDAGTGTYKIVRSLITMDFAVVSANPRILGFNSTVAFSRSRFDTAGLALGGVATGNKLSGAVMSDYIPTAVFDKSATSPYRAEAKHIDDALHHTSLTFPSFSNKFVPGEGAFPLHRLMDSIAKDNNHDASVRVCVAVWGPNYAQPRPPGRDCDEYPFQSTYEGSYTSTNGNPFQWNGSARAIDSTQNQNGGTHLQQFYINNRILDENVGSGQTGPTDPFRVAITG
ncbi:hypothetical protein [Actinoplanes sp. NPDC026623]|uniref:NucA/NucB deoxyribonuclease domain-containing protein n=1 Tax=Actinoplanes sp. NPDC026623 TaxID=3155610 RepID=UPI0034041511